MKKYRHLFFDLDHTLWDFNKNTSITLNEVLSEFGLASRIKSSKEFIGLYNKYNDFVWNLYRDGKIKKNALRTERFRLLLNDYNLVDSELVRQISDYYLDHSPNQPGMIDGAYDVLGYLQEHYKLYIISNGFYETQLRKIKAAGIEAFFTRIYTSERVGFSKPHKSFFDYAIKSSNAKKKESLVIGDSLENDIAGAKNSGIDQVWFNPNNTETSFKPTYTINSLTELMQIL